jgi:hypothetical protein
MVRVPPGASELKACSIALRCPTASKAYSAPRPRVRSLIAWTTSPSRPSITCVAPKRFAHSSLVGTRSTAMILEAPASTPPWMMLSPIPPAPNTTIERPVSTLARFSTAPTPVMMPQPISAAWAIGICFGIGIALDDFTTVSWENVELLAKLYAGVPPTVNGVLGRGGL